MLSFELGVATGGTLAGGSGAELLVCICLSCIMNYEADFGAPLPMICAGECNVRLLAKHRVAASTIACTIIAMHPHRRLPYTQRRSIGSAHAVMAMHAR